MACDLGRGRNENLRRAADEGPESLVLLRNGLAGSTFEFREAGTAYLVAKIAPRIFGKRNPLRKPW